MMARRVVARPSLGQTGAVWVEITPAVSGESLGAHLSIADALRLAGALLLAVEELETERAS